MITMITPINHDENIMIKYCIVITISKHTVKQNLDHSDFIVLCIHFVHYCN